MALSSAQRRYLRSLCHALNPVLTIAERGLADSVRAELERTLAHHELIKIRLTGDREQKAVWISELLEATGADLVQTIGHVVSIYRRNPEAQKIDLPPR